VGFFTSYMLFKVDRKGFLSIYDMQNNIKQILFIHCIFLLSFVTLLWTHKTSYRFFFHVESSLITFSKSMSRKSQNKEYKFHIFPVSILLLIPNHIDDVKQLHNPQLCRYNPIPGSTGVRHITFPTHFM